MTVQEKAVEWAVGIANDDSHGYSQSSRWSPDYDCSSLVISAYEYAGAKVKTNGATYTGNMYPVFLRSGFSDVTAKVNLATGSGLVAGDVLLNVNSHTAMYIGGGRIVHATGNEFGGVTGGLPGDQTGREVTTANFFNFPWDYVLRYTAKSSASGNTSAPVNSVAQHAATDLKLSVGDIVYFNGSSHYVSSDSDARYPCVAGEAKVTSIALGAKHPYHLIGTGIFGTSATVYGWVNASDIEAAKAQEVASSNNSDKPKTESGTGAKETTYTVVAGDNLSAIAYKLLGRWSRYKEIKELNGLTSDTIYPGQVLKIPKK